ncbi:HAD family phosphatase [Flavivirga sp. 57AJ16]|uniref:HAD family hydrolase n=1 Tax=Flavivirga sp. 57AJ16 TaxID=3025307 RepID=UPI00236692B8|nr:HAD-IA family hydrolase [Flavivirga sp. 57AJ16]MDD7886205.1 HAD-IA family hydrolase [Flavivirga sp. 57AJ16]
MNKAFIFDMDGVIIDTESFWESAEYNVFSKLGVKVLKEYSHITKNMDMRSVCNFWYEKQPWGNKNFDIIEQEVLNEVKSQIKDKGVLIPGIKELLKKIKTEGYKVGISSNAPLSLIKFVVTNFKIENYFDCICSADLVENAKPFPDVYLLSSKLLKIPVEDCIAIEDSITGLKAAKRANMSTIYFNNFLFNINYKKELIDYHISDFKKINIKNII